MRILLIGATGTIGEAVAAELAGRHELVRAGRTSGDEQVDLGDPASVRALFGRVGRVDAVVSAAGLAAFKPLAELSDDDFAFSLANKLMGQVNVVRYGLGSVTDGGSITLTSGTLGQHPEPGTPAISLVNAGLEGFTRAAALEAPRGIRVNVVSPPWVTETLRAMGRSWEGGLPAAVVAKAYVRSVEGKETGEVLSPPDGDAGHDRDSAGALVGAGSGERR
jgi:NAD(P)-dependent dehydrogenase (short-subunit alcohol dehydrogenase family)